MSRSGDVAPEVLARVRAICLAFPETREEQAWVGTRWCVRTKTFAAVLVVENGWPPAYARAAGTYGPATMVTFRAAGEELAALRAGGAPFFAPPWRSDEVGLVLDEAVAWQEVAEFLTESYRVQAPKRLGAGVKPPHQCPRPDSS